MNRKMVSSCHYSICRCNRNNPEDEFRKIPITILSTTMRRVDYQKAISILKEMELISNPHINGQGVAVRMGIQGIRKLQSDEKKGNQGMDRKKKVCANCGYFKPKHVKLNDGKERMYTEEDRDILGIPFVDVSIGTNIGSQCFYDKMKGVTDRGVFRTPGDYCSRFQKGDNIPLNTDIEKREDNEKQTDRPE